MEFSFTLCVPREELSVPVVRRICCGALRTFGVSDECVHDVGVALTEACTNVLKHATTDGDEYEVEVRIEESRCHISVHDSGSGFDHHAAVRRSVVAAAESGRGLHLMSALSDDLRFASGPDSGTVVQLSKELAMEEESAVGRMLARKPGDRRKKPPLY